MNDLLGDLDPQRLVLLVMIGIAVLAVAIGTIVVALIILFIWVRAKQKKIAAKYSSPWEL